MVEPLSKREFLKIAGATAAGVAVKAIEVEALSGLVNAGKEKLSKNSVKIGALRTGRVREENSVNQSIRILTEIEKALKSDHLDLLVTPEFSFQMHWGQEKDYAGMPLILKRVEEKRFVVEELKSDKAPKVIIENATSLAQQYKSNLLLATFFDPDGGENTAAVYINSEGVITGLKRKFQPPLGAFEIEQGRNTLKILPVLCGEAWGNPPDMVSSAHQKWVREGAPFDILTHSLQQGDVDINGLAKLVYGETGIDESRLYGQDKTWLQSAFNSYYGEYFPFLRPNAPIIISDWGMAGAFDKKLEAIKAYEDTGGYVTATVPLSQSSPK